MGKLCLFFLLLFSISFTSSTLIDDVQHYYKFDDNDLTDSLFLSNGTNDGTTQIPGIINDGRHFDGSNDVINFTTLGTFGSDVSYSVWASTNSTTCTAGHCAIFWVRGTPVNGIEEYLTFAGTEIQFVFANAPGSNNRFTTSGAGIVAETYYHIVVNGSGIGTAGGWQIWINGTNQSVDFASQGGDRNRPTGNYFITLGNRLDLALGFLHGSVDELGIFNKSFFQDQIGELYNDGTGLQYPFVSDSCSYTSGNWVVDCADNCTISSAVVGDGSNFSCIGTGTFNINANISGFNKYHFGGACVATCDDGCIKF